jgi:hypothetical protein
MRSLMMMLGLPDMPTPEFIVFLGLVAGSALLLGWIADAILGNAGFGVIPNAVILLGGAILGALAWQRLGYVLGADRNMVMAIVGAASGIVALLAGGVMKRFV